MEVTAPWREPEPEAAAAAAMTLAEVKTELRDDETAKLGAIWSKTHRNLGELRRWRR